jgi:hypothetical protein
MAGRTITLLHLMNMLLDMSIDKVVESSFGLDPIPLPLAKRCGKQRRKQHGSLSTRSTYQLGKAVKC